MSLNVISVPPIKGKTPQGLIVLLHGWGANAQDLAPLASMLGLPEFQFLFPNAPFPHPYAPPGSLMWYDLEKRDAQQLAASRQQLLDWLGTLAQETGVPSERTILGGFSQGGAMTLEVGLSLPLAALVVLSGYLHPRTQSDAASAAPIFMAHGRQDPVVPLTAAQQAKESLIAMGVALEYQEFDMGHEIRPEVLSLLRDFVLKHVCDRT